jgi:hypothetical protein
MDFLHAQEGEPDPAPVIEQQLEELAEANDIETEDDSYLQQLEQYLKHPLNLNQATVNDLSEFKMLSDLQVQHFIVYRDLFGSLLNIYELQAIPSWDIPTIRKLIPYIIISDSKTISQNLRERMFVGDNTLMLRFSMIVPKSNGYLREDSATNYYKGSRPHILLRYKYNYKNLLQYGFLGDKDAGEQFFRGAQKSGFDFYSFHFFARKSGMVKALAVGDFTVNLGQGLTHWQSLAFKKSASIVFVKRQADVLRPYSSSGEYNFHRGLGITLEKKNWEATAFVSTRKLSATIKRDSDRDKDGYVSSLLSSGNHRTGSEIEDRNNLRSFTMGSNIKYTTSRWHTGINWVHYSFSKPFRPSGQPYDQFTMDGNTGTNVSIDYGFTYRNVHVFGELGADKNFNKAIINGIIGSIDRSVDIALVYRKIDIRYQSLYGNGFTENTLLSNETGLYTGFSFRPAKAWKIDAYADLYKFPWLLFRADAPSYGYEYLLQVTFTPNKRVGISLRHKKEAKQANYGTELPTSPVISIPRRNLRYHLSYNINREITIGNRVELSWYEEQIKQQTGYLVYAEVKYKPYSRPYSANARLQYFETDGYAARIYAYENDVLYGYSTPAFFEKGFRWYLNVKTDVSRWRPLRRLFKLEVWLKYAITHYFELDKIGTELDEIQGKQRSEIKFQLIISR